jgi:hypothetical protein
MSGMSRIAAVLALAAACGGLVSCGGARSSGVGRTGTASTVQSPPLTRPRAVAFVHAVNLRSGDVPGFTSSGKREHRTAAEKSQQRTLLRCMGATGGVGSLAEASSPNFERARGLLKDAVSSSVSVQRTSTASGAELAQLRSGHTRGCLQSYLDGLFTGPTFRAGHVGHVSIKTGVPPALGTAGSFAWRITVPFNVRSIRLPFYLDILGFIDGSAQVMLFSSGFPLPFPAAAQEHLFALLVARAKAHQA